MTYQPQPHNLQNLVMYLVIYATAVCCLVSCLPLFSEESALLSGGGRGFTFACLLVVASLAGLPPLPLFVAKLAALVSLGLNYGLFTITPLLALLLVLWVSYLRLARSIVDDPQKSRPIPQGHSTRNLWIISIFSLLGLFTLTDISILASWLG